MPSPYNDEKFLKALTGLLNSTSSPLALPAPVAPAVPDTTTDFAAFMAAHNFGNPGKAAAASVIKDSTDEDNRGALGKTFGWLSSFGNMTEQMVMDTKEGDSPIFGGDALTALNRVGAAVASAVQPVAEIAAIPGVHVPIVDDAVDKLGEYAYKKNYMRGDTPISGARVADEVLGIDNKVGKFATGLALDIGLDPLTYVSPGGAVKLGKGLFGAKSLTKAEEAEKAIADAARSSANTVPTVAAAEESMAGVPAALGKPSVAVPKLNTGLEATRQSVSPPFYQEIPLPETIKSSTPNYLAGTKQLDSPSLSFGERMNALKASKVSDDILFEPKKSGPTTKYARPNSGGILKTDVKVPAVNPHVVGKAISDLIASPVTQRVPTLRPLMEESPELARRVETQTDKYLKTVKGHIEPKNQTNLWSKMQGLARPVADSAYARTAPAWKTARDMKAVQLLIHATENAVNNGREVVGFNGTGVTLADIFRQVDPQAASPEVFSEISRSFGAGSLAKEMSAPASDAFERAIAERAVATGQVASREVKAFSAADPVAREGLSPQKYTAWKKTQAKLAQEAALKLGGLTPAEARSVKSLVEVHVPGASGLDSLDIAERLGPKLAQSLATGKVDKSAIRQMERAIVGSDYKSLSAFNKVRHIEQNFEKNMMERLSTWYGRGDMIHLWRQEHSFVQSAARARSRALGHLVSSFSKDQLKNAFILAQKMGFGDMQKMSDMLDPDTVKAASFIRDYMDNVMAGFNKSYDAEGTLAANSQLVREDLNKQLRAIGSGWEFPKPGGKATDVPWTDAWRHVGKTQLKNMAANPVAFLYNLDTAIGRVHAQYAVVDDFVSRFGTSAPNAHNTLKAVAHHRADAMYYNPEEFRQFKALMTDMATGSWRPGTKGTKFMSSALRKWKSSVTIYYPAHHIRNMVGDAWLMWVSGINDPRVFSKALRVLHSQKARYNEVIKSGNLDELTTLLNRDRAGWYKADPSTTIVKKYGSNINASELYGEAFSRGLLPDAAHIEDIVGGMHHETGARTSLSELVQQPFKGKVHEAASTVSEYREHYIRLAHLVGYVEKHMTPDLGKKLAKTESPEQRSELLKSLFDDAAKQIRKNHPDGTDLSNFEQKFMRNIVPFYSWQRKSIPLLVEAAVMRPSKVMLYPRGMYAMQGATGVDVSQGSPSDPFPQDQLFPDWIRAGGIGPIGDAESENPFTKWWGVLGRNPTNSFGHKQGYTVVDPGNPFNDFVSDTFGMGHSVNSMVPGIGGQITPFFSVPAQFMTKTETTGAPIPTQEGGQGYTSFLAEQIPQLSLALRTSGIGQHHKEGLPTYNTEALLNRILGMGVIGTGQYTKSAEFDQRDALRYGR